MKEGLILKEKSFYLPYSRRTAPMIYFDAREVFASLLSCPLLNCDENYLFDSPEKHPFVGPTKLSIIGDINTGRCYRKTHKVLVKIPDVNMILPTIMAMDKTQVDTYGWLQMEPLVISHGRMKHSVCS
jgi:Plavaka transposase